MIPKTSTVRKQRVRMEIIGREWPAMKAKNPDSSFSFFLECFAMHSPFFYEFHWYAPPDCWAFA